VFARARAVGRDVRLEYRMATADGQLNTGSTNIVRPVAGDDGRVRRIQGLMLDVTQRKRLTAERDICWRWRRPPRPTRGVRRAGALPRRRQRPACLSLDQAATLDSLVRLAVPGFADCVSCTWPSHRGPPPARAGEDREGTGMAAISSGWLRRPEPSGPRRRVQAAAPMGSARCTTHQSAKPGTASRTRLSSVAAWSSEEGKQVAGAGEEARRSADASASAWAACAISSRWSRSAVSRLRWVTSKHQPLDASHAAVVSRHRPHDVVDPDELAVGRRHAVLEADVAGPTRALAQHGEDGVAIVGMDQRVPESRLLKPLADGMAEHRLRSLAHESDPERGRSASHTMPSSPSTRPANRVRACRAPRYCRP